MNHAAPLTAIRDALVGGGQAQLATAEAIAALAGEVRELRTEIAAVAYAATQPAPQTEAMRAMAEEIAVLRAEVDALKTKPAEPRRVLRNLLGGGQ